MPWPTDGLACANKPGASVGGLGAYAWRQEPATPLRRRPGPPRTGSAASHARRADAAHTDC